MSSLYNIFSFIFFYKMKILFFKISRSHIKYYRLLCDILERRTSHYLCLNEKITGTRLEFKGDVAKSGDRGFKSSLGRCLKRN